MEKIQQLTVENVLLKAQLAGKYAPVNLSQVVRAVLSAPYAALLDYDEDTDELDRRSVERAIKRLAENEPTLFTTTKKDDDPNGRKVDETMLKQALDLLGIKK